MFKCCWNCNESALGHCFTRKATALFSVSKRFCCALYPVSNYAENPFQKRYCKQFTERIIYTVGHEISKDEADKLYQMTDTERAEYFKVVVPE